MTELDRQNATRKAVLPMLFLGLLLAQPATAVSYPITIQYGRSWPLSVVVDSSRGFAYVDGMSGIYPPTGFTFGVINLTSHELVKTFPLDEIPEAMAIDQSSGNVYIGGGESIQVFDGGNQSMGRRIEIGHPVRSVAFDGVVSQDLFVTAGNQVFSVDLQSGRVARNASVGNGANGMAIDTSTGRLYVSEYPDSEVYVFQAQDLTPVETIRIPVCCAGQMVVNPKMHMLFAATGTKFVEIINTRTDFLQSSTPVASSSQNSTNLVTIDDATGRVFVSSSPGGSIIELDSTGDAVVGGFKVASQVAGMAVDSKTHELYATNYHEVTVFNLSRAPTLSLLLATGATIVAVAVAAVILVFPRSTSPRPST